MADNLRATPRNVIPGLFSDIVQGAYDFGSKPFGYSNPPAQMIMNALGVPDVAATLNRMSYGEPQFTGSGMTLKPREEMINAAMAVAPFAPKVGGFAARGAGEALNAAMMGESKGLLGKIVPQPKFLDVWHGSPHRFPPTERNPLGEFDASKIGTGEGAQAYGHGIYVAEAPKVGKGYQIALAPEKNLNSLTDRARFVKVGDKSITPDTFDIDISQELIDAAKLGKNEFINFANQRKSRWQELANDESYKFKTYAQDKLFEYNNLIKEAKKSGVTYTGGGNLYKADLPDAMIPKMLDYDKHLSEQSAEIQKILLPYQKEIGSSFGTGEQILKELAFDRRMKGLDDSPSAISKQLQEMGIPGIKYLDEQSRGTKYSGDSAYFHASNSFKDSGYTFDQALEGMKQAYKNANQKELKDALDAVYAPKTQNFVVFPGEEKSMKILERNTGDTNKLQNKVNSTPTNPFYQDPFGNPFAETIR